MKARLTLTIDEEVVMQAKAYAAATGATLSEIVENYFRLLTSGAEKKRSHSPAVKTLKGIVSLPARETN